jgi:Secretion system C-terminal sorting domain
MNYPASFCISSTTNVNDLSVVLIPIDHARPGFSSYYRLHYENNGTTSLSGSVKVTYNNNKLTLGTFNSNLPDATTANSASYNFTNLLPYQYGDIFITFNVLTPPTVNQGDILTFTTLGTTTVTDANLADNTFVLNQSVVNSFDPNDKTVLEGATITAAQATRPLHYITRFQNTGTFAAVTVVLKETLDADLNWNTIEPIGSSHNYRIQIKNGNQLTVTFDAINLPNSSANEPASHGWFAYKIKPKSTFAVGNVASSNASIYFDYNLPIVTNTVNTQISTLATDGFNKNNFKIYPNPANTYFVIENSLGKSSTYEIVTINGKTLSSGIVENLKPIDISELASGFYFVNIKSQDAKQTYKIVKE